MILVLYIISKKMQVFYEKFHSHFFKKIDEH